MIPVLYNYTKKLFTSLTKNSAYTINPLRNISFSTQIDRIRNIGLCAHIDAGKTSTAECLLFNAHEIDYRGNIDDGTTHMDFLPQETKHGITIQSAVTTIHWKQHQINLIDTPGHIDFIDEVRRGLSALDGAIVILDGVNGVEAQTESIWRQINQANSVKRLIFINKLDRDGASMEYCENSINERLFITPLTIQLPLRKFADQTHFYLVDLVRLKIFIYPLRNKNNIYLKHISPTCIPLTKEYDKELWKKVCDLRCKLFEDIADLDDDFAEIFLNEKAISIEDIWSALKRITNVGSGVIVICGSALENIGIDLLMDAIVLLLPSPSQFSRYTPLNPNSRIHELYKKACKQHTRDSNLTNRALNLVSCRGPLNEMMVNTTSTPSFLCFKVLSDRKGGRLVYCRILSGVIRPQMKFFNTHSGCVENIIEIFRIKADQYSKLSSIPAGDIAMFRGLRETIAGDTLISCDTIARDESPFIINIQQKALSPICFCQFIVDSQIEEEKLMAALTEMCLSDSSLHAQKDEEMGQILVWGLGELHISIIKERLFEEYGLNVEIGKMEIAYKEYISDPIDIEINHEMTLSGRSHSMTIKMSISSNPLTFELEHSDDHLEEESHQGLDKTQDLQNKVFFVPSIYDLTMKNHSDPTFKPIPIDKLNEIIQTIKNTLSEAFNNGPLIGAPIISLNVTVQSIQIEPQTPLGVVKACTAKIFKNIQASSTSILLEPVMTLIIFCEDVCAGTVINDLTRQRRAQIKDVISNSGSNASLKSMQIKVTIPLKSMIGYSRVLQSLTHGNVSFHLEPNGYQPLEGQELFLLLDKRKIKHTMD